METFATINNAFTPARTLTALLGLDCTRVIVVSYLTSNYRALAYPFGNFCDYLKSFSFKSLRAVVESYTRSQIMTNGNKL